MAKSRKRSQSGIWAIVLIVCFIFVAFGFITYSRENAKFEKHEAIIKETNECLAAGDWKCAERNVRELLKTEPNDTNLRMHLAGLLLEQERYKECLNYIESLDFKSEKLDYFAEKAKRLEQEMENLGVEKSMHFRLEFDGSLSCVAMTVISMIVILSFNVRTWTRDTDRGSEVFWRTRMEAMERIRKARV